MYDVKSNEHLKGFNNQTYKILISYLSRQELGPVKEAWTLAVLNIYIHLRLRKL